VESIEIGNEPGHYSDTAYRVLFENMAKGLRQGDPKLKVVTCATTTGASEKYSKSLSCVKGLEALYDVINIHTYAFAEQYPTWRRSYPEDASLKYLTPMKEAITWRNANAPGKEIWITEFGWDASTKPAPPTGDFSKWMSSTDTQQAQYLVRSFLVFSTLDVDRAYIYFFNDKDEPQLHGSSGLTRDYKPKPAFHAVAHLYRTLGDYRFSRIVTEEAGKLAVYEYRHGTKANERIWVAWSPTGANRQMEVTLPAPGGTVYQAERMPLKAGEAETVRWEARKDGKPCVIGERVAPLSPHARSLSTAPTIRGRNTEFRPLIACGA
jgi:serine/threonine-protein kinase ATR